MEAGLSSSRAAVRRLCKASSAGSMIVEKSHGKQATSCFPARSGVSQGNKKVDCLRTVLSHKGMLARVCSKIIFYVTFWRLSAAAVDKRR